MRDTSPAPAHVVDSLGSRLGRSHLLRLLTAFVLALLTWGWVMQATDPIRTDNYTEVEITQPELENDLVLVTNLPRGSITVEGPESEVAKINRSRLSLRLDTSEVTDPGEYRLPIIVEAPDTSNRVTVDPRTLLVQIDEMTSRVVPIEIEETSSEDSTRVVNNITTDVSQVTVSGPSSAVDRVQTVVLPVTIDTQVSTFSEYFTPYAVDDNGQRVSEVTVLPGQILTRVDLQTRGRLVTVIADIQGQPADGYSIQQRTVIPSSILVEGPDEALDNLLFIDTEPVDISGASQSVSSRVGLSNLPEGVTVVEPISSQVEVRVAIQDTSATSQTLSNLPINALNVPPGFNVVIVPETIDITVQGSASNITSMTPDDITIVVDVNGLEAGEHTLRPVVALPNNGVMSTGTNPETVTVSLEPANSTPEPESNTPLIHYPDMLAESARYRHNAVRRVRIPAAAI